MFDSKEFSFIFLKWRERLVNRRRIKKGGFHLFNFGFGGNSAYFKFCNMSILTNMLPVDVGRAFRPTTPLTTTQLNNHMQQSLRLLCLSHCRRQRRKDRSLLLFTLVPTVSVGIHTMLLAASAFITTWERKNSPIVAESDII